MSDLYTGISTIQAVLQQLQADRTIEDHHKTLASEVIHYYFEVCSNWHASPGACDGFGPDAIIYKAAHNEFHENIVVLRKPTGDPIIPAMGRLGRYLKSQGRCVSCFVIIFIGVEVGFFEFYDSDNFSTIRTINGTVGMEGYAGDLVPLTPSYSIRTPDKYRPFTMVDVVALGLTVEMVVDQTKLEVCVWDLTSEHHAVYIDEMFRNMAYCGRPERGHAIVCQWFSNSRKRANRCIAGITGLVNGVAFDGV